MRIQGLLVPKKVSNAAVYGNYYASTFQVKVPGSPAVLILLWAKEAGQWKIVSYLIELP